MSDVVPRIVLTVAAIALAASLSLVIALQVAEIDQAWSASASESGEDLRTDVAILNDRGAANGTYNDTAGTVTLYVRNTGTRTLGANASVVDVLVDGRYQAAPEVTVLSGEDWEPGGVVRIRVSIDLETGRSHRAVVIVDGARDEIEFYAHARRLAPDGPAADPSLGPGDRVSHAPRRGPAH